MLESVLERMTPDYAKSSDIKWNLTKFLVDRKGNVVTNISFTSVTYTQYIAMMVMWEKKEIPMSLRACVNLERQEAQQLYRLLYKLLDGLS